MYFHTEIQSVDTNLEYEMHQLLPDSPHSL